MVGEGERLLLRRLIRPWWGGTLQRRRSPRRTEDRARCRRGWPGEVTGALYACGLTIRSRQYRKPSASDFVCGIRF